MTKDNIHLLESFFLPGARHRLPTLYKHLDNNEIDQVSRVLADHIKSVSRLKGRRLNLTESDLTDLLVFLQYGKAFYLNRLSTIKLRLSR